MGRRSAKLRKQGKDKMISEIYGVKITPQLIDDRKKCKELQGKPEHVEHCDTCSLRGIIMCGVPVCGVEHFRNRLDAVISEDAKNAESSNVTRRDCLQSAIEIVCKDREDTYGSPEDNFDLIAALWTEYTGTELSSKDVAMMMALLKIARIKTGKYKADNFIDLAGYAACACEIGDNNEN